MPPKRRTPTRLGQELGNRLREARENTPGRPSALAVSAAIGVHHSTVGRAEDGTRPASPENVEKILDYLVSLGLDLDNEDRTAMMEIARGDDIGAWLAVSMPQRYRQQDALLKLERDAVRIVRVSPLRVPGLCQTQDYAEAIARRADIPEREIGMRVAAKIGRREALFRKNPAHFLALIGEAVLRQRIGGPAVMAGQLRFLLELSEWDNIDIQIVPDAVDSHPGLDGPFVIEETGDGRKVVYLENALSGLFLTQEQDVAAYEDAVQKVLREAMSRDLSIQRIAREAEQFERMIQQ